MVDVFVCKVCAMKFGVFSNARKHVKEKHSGTPLNLIDKVWINGKHKS